MRIPGSDRQGPHQLGRLGGIRPLPRSGHRTSVPLHRGQGPGQQLVIYRDHWKVRDYFLFQTDDGGLEGFQLVKSAYVTTRANQDGRHPCRSLPLLLGVHQGWLRFYTQDGQLLLTDEERADQERERADQERARADQLATRLKELGFEV